MKPSLESLCALKQRERQEDVTGLRCMLCKDVLEGKRAVLFEHLWQKHHFFIGSAGEERGRRRERREREKESEERREER